MKEKVDAQDIISYTLWMIKVNKESNITQKNCGKNETHAKTTQQRNGVTEITKLNTKN